MPLYDFRCPAEHVAEVMFSFQAAPATTECATCAQPAARLISSPRLSRASDPAFGLIERTKRSAHEPEVVHSLGAGKGPRTRYTADPLHQKLPRP